MPELEVCPLEELPVGSRRLVDTASGTVGVFHCADGLSALEDRCSHDDGPLCEGEWEPGACQVVCPRHGARFDLRTGRPLSLPAYVPVATYPVRVRDDGMVVVELG